MTSTFWKLYPDSSTDTNESNNGTKAIIEGQSSISSIVSANTSLTNKGKSNPHHHFIFTKDPFRIPSSKISDQMTRLQISIPNYPIMPYSQREKSKFIQCKYNELPLTSNKRQHNRA